MYDGAVALDDEIIWGGSPLVLVLNYRVERAFTDNCCRTDMGRSVVMPKTATFFRLFSRKSHFCHVHVQKHLEMPRKGHKKYIIFINNPKCRKPR